MPPTPSSFFRGIFSHLNCHQLMSRSSRGRDEQQSQLAVFFLLTTNGLRCLLSVLLFVTTLATVGKQHHRTMFDHPQSIIFFSFAEWQPSVDASHQLRDFVDEKNKDIRLLPSDCCYIGEDKETIARVTVMHFSAGSLNCIPSPAFSRSTLFSSRSGTHY